MRKKQRVIAMLMAATLIGGSLSGCGGNGKENEGAASGSGDKVEISFWTQDSTTYMGGFKEAVEKFNAQSDTVEVKAEYFPNFSDKLSQAFSADQQPDVAFTWQGITPWAKAGKLAPVSEECMTKEEMEEQFYEGALRNKMYEDTYYCVPAEINVESPNLFVNMDLLKKMDKELPASWIENNGPATWEELLEFAKEVTVKDGDTVTQSGLAYLYSSWEAMFASLIWQYGGDYRDEENSVVHFDTEEGKKAAEFLLKYCKGKEAISDSGTSRYDLFTQGSAVMCIGAPWYSSSFGISSRSAGPGTREKQKNRVVIVGQESDCQDILKADYEVTYRIPENAPQDSETGAYLFCLVFSQLLSMEKSLEKGYATDNPCPRGDVNRVVQGIVIYNRGAGDEIFSGN